MKKLVIVGAGGFGREVYNWALADEAYGRDWEIAGFIDDNLAALDAYKHASSVLGRISDYEPKPDEVFICAIGSPEVKKAVCEKLLKRSACFTNVVHPSALIGSNVEMGRGVIVCPNVVVTCDVKIGDYVTLNCHTSVGHDVRIGDWVTASGHCDITGQTELGEGAFLGSGARILPLKRVGAGALVGAGSVVISHVAPNTKVFGNPARVFE